MSVLSVSLSFARLGDSELGDFSQNVVTRMMGNASYPTPEVPLVEITDARTTFVQAVVAAAQGGKQLTAAKNAARAVLESLLRRQAAYVESIAMDDLTMLLSSGFWNNPTERVRRPLTQPAILNIDNIASSQLLARVTALDNARAYEARHRVVGTPEWRNGGVFTNSRALLLEALTPGQMYEVQVRGVGGSTGYSPWSDSVTHMAM